LGIFATVEEAEVFAEQWRREYNKVAFKVPGIADLRIPIVF
jgi:hypothetical protein